MGARGGGGVLGRRGLLAGAAALVAGGMATLGGAGRAQAAHDTGGTPEVLHAGVANTTANTTVIDISSSVSDGDAIVAIATRRYAAGVRGRSGGENGDGVVGVADGAYGTGVSGQCLGLEGIGVHGSGRLHGVYGWVAVATTDPDASGVWGEVYSGAASGVRGETTSDAANATGVFGLARLGTANPTVGVRGRSNSTSSGAIGTFGESTNGSGVRGLSTSGNGVFGVSTNASGVFGFSNLSYGAAGVSNTGIGVYASSAGNWGLHASSPTFAGVFSGNVYINGSYTATGAKSAAVKNKRGEHRRMYCQESPEAWFEDFGEATLANGRAVVQLDAEFDEVVKGDNYQVFLTAYGDLGTLYVADRRPHRFEVRSERGASAAGSFGYRVVARRLDDVGRRLEKIDVLCLSTRNGPL